MKHKVKSLTTIAAVLVLAVFLCATAWAAQNQEVESAGRKECSTGPQ